MNKKFMTLLGSVICYTILCPTLVLSVEPSGLIIYINPGHGGHDSDDRNVVIAPFTAGDPDGFWESNSNLDKGLALRDMLEARGTTVVMSRVTNTTDDDLGLTTIGGLANDSGADIFISIHSNATGTTTKRNAPLALFRGYDNDPVIPEAKVLATFVNNQQLTNGVTIWTSTSTNVRGDWDFYDWGTQGLGVLRILTIPGMLSEGEHHDYIPETYRLMNLDYKWLEAWNFRKAIDQYFEMEGISTGGIIGRINDARVLREGDFVMFDEDKYAPINGATVTLYDTSGTTVLQTCTTDELFNGVYAFKDLEPGTYHIRVEQEEHFDIEADAEVVADEMTYLNLKMSKVRNTPPEVINYSPVWSTGDGPILCNTPVIMEFNWDMDEATTEAAFSITPAVEGSIAWEDQNYRMVFTPTNAYATNTLYTVRLAETAEHAGGMQMESPVEFSFMTDNRDYMTIIGQFPKDGDEMHYAKSSNIEVRFDNTLNATPILNQISVVDSKGAEVAFNKRSLSYGKSTDDYGYFRIPFTNDLTVGESYVLTLSHEIADNDGITLRENQVINFTAVDVGEEKPDTAIDTMNDATLYFYDESASTNVSSAKTAKDTSNALFDKACVTFSYTFPESEGSTVVWSRTEPAELEACSKDALGVHVYGDLSGNVLYAEMTSDVDVKFVTLCDLDFLGWKYIEIPLSMLEDENPYKLIGIELIQTPSVMGKNGEIKLDNINLIKEGNTGIENVEVPGLTIYPNPASEYLIANADGLINHFELISVNGTVIKSANGNVLNVSDVTNGVYIASVYTANGRSVRKVIIAH